MPILLFALEFPMYYWIRGGTAMAQILTAFDGLVTDCNKGGLKLDGDTGWRNYSKFAPIDDIDKPDKGDWIAGAVDKDGFIRELHITEKGVSVQANPLRSPKKDREPVITRLALLNTATHILTTRGEVNEYDVITLAEELERWVYTAPAPIE